MRQFMSLAPSAQYILSAGPLVKSWMQSGLFSTSTSVQLAQHDSSGMLTCGLGLRLQTMRPMMGDMIKPRPWVEKTSETLTPRDLLSEADSAATVAASGYVDAADADAEDEARNHDPDELAVGACVGPRMHRAQRHTTSDYVINQHTTHTRARRDMFAHTGRSGQTARCSRGAGPAMMRIDPRDPSLVEHGI